MATALDNSQLMMGKGSAENNFRFLIDQVNALCVNMGLNPMFSRRARWEARNVAGWDMLETMCGLMVIQLLEQYEVANGSDRTAIKAACARWNKTNEYAKARRDAQYK